MDGGFSQFYGGGNENLLVSWRDWWLVVAMAMVYFLSFYLSFCFFSYFAFVLVVFFFTLLPSFASEVKLNLKILMIEYCE